MRDDASVQEDPILAALREIQTLSQMPVPVFTAPPWEKIRAALPPGITLPERPVHVLVDLDIDAGGTVVHAVVGQIPASMLSPRTVAACVGPEGDFAIQPPLDSASSELAHAVAAGLVGARFTPAERGGQPVAVRQFRMGIEVRPEILRSGSEGPR